MLHKNLCEDKMFCRQFPRRVTRSLCGFLPWRQRPAAPLLPLSSVSPSSMALSTSPAAPSPPPPSDFKSLMREYGPISLGVYFSLSFTLFCICFASISFLGLDPALLQSLFSRLKALVGLGHNSEDSAKDGSSSGNSDQDKLKWLPPWALAMGPNFFLALAMTKLLIPVKVGLTAYLTPRVAKKLRGLGFQLGKKGGLRDAQEQIKQTWKEK